MFSYKTLSELPTVWSDLELIKRRQRKETLREVYVEGEQRLFKRYIINTKTVFYSRPWALEAKALEQAKGLPVPKYLATYAGLGEHGYQEFVFERTFLPGTRIDLVSAKVVEEMAKLLAALHRRGIVTHDATIDNFIQSPTRSLCFIDFGKARIHRLPFYYDIGSELARFLHGTLLYDEHLWRLFLDRYIRARRIEYVSKAIEQFFFRFCKRSRMRRRALNSSR